MSGKVVVSMGSLNPPHKGHLGLFDEILKDNEKFHLFVRYNEGIDLAGRDVKAKWFERISADRDNRIIVHIFSMEDMKGKNYSPHIFANAIHYFESILGEPIDEIWAGEDATPLLEGMDKEFPNLRFVITKRNGFNSTAIRNNLEGHKDWLPDFVYEDLVRIMKGE